MRLQYLILGVVSILAHAQPSALMPNVALQDKVSALQNEVTLLQAANHTLAQRQQKWQSIQSMVPNVQWRDWYHVSIPTAASDRSFILFWVLFSAVFLWWHGLALAQRPNASEEEYNFLESDEAIPAKLDLAQAYMAMGDRDSAFSVLSEVLVSGDEAQRAHAQRIMSQVA